MLAELLPLSCIYKVDGVFSPTKHCPVVTITLNYYSWPHWVSYGGQTGIALCISKIISTQHIFNLPSKSAPFLIFIVHSLKTLVYKGDWGVISAYNNNCLHHEI